MNKRSFFQNLLIGKDEIKSKSEYKYALLRGQLALLLGGICFMYIFVDALNGVTIFISWYLLFILASVFIIYLNRIHKYLASTVLLIGISNIVVYFFAAVDNPSSGVFFFFTSAALIALILFDRINRWYSVVSIAITFGLAFFAYLGDYSPIPPPVQSEFVNKVNFVINFSLGLFSSILVLYFVLKRNSESEKTLINKQSELEDVATELEKSHLRFKKAVEGANAGIYEWKVEINELFVSDQWLNLLGYSDQSIEINIALYLSWIHPDDREEAQNAIRNAIESRGEYKVERRLKCFDGTYRWFLDSGVIWGEKGATVVSGSLIDINDRKFAEQELVAKNLELLKINEELDRFVYSASHDMRAPLSTMLGLLQLSEKSRDSEELSKYHDMMKDRIHTMEGFIKDITDYSRNARVDLNLEQITLSEVVNKVVSSFEVLANKANCKIVVDIDDEATVCTDKNRLKVVLNNLILNAIKYSDSDKDSALITIETHTLNGSCSIFITDNGLGIDSAYMDKIFDMFFRANENSDGSGLGLYIVRETMNKLGGEINVTSEKGKGSKFEIVLPSKQ